ncbi:MAG: hypothetical protein JWL77_5658 [Chthonomonadaceae bacterium]|nr:hypothetical protein [Chthonomonadaceae bacterium]
MLHLLFLAFLGILALLLGTILTFFIGFYVRHQYRELVLWHTSTEKRLEDRQVREPDNPIMAEKLATLYIWRKNRSAGETRQEQALKAFLWYERAYQLTTDKLHKLGMLHNLAKLACDAFVDEKAAEYATELLRSLSEQPNYGKGSAVHDGNLVFGRLALRRGKIAEAKKYLLKAGRTTGGPGLNTGGPDMILAQELLEQRESETVLQYFALCATFWKMDYGKLKRWTRQVQNGQTPDFGKQLYR